MMGRYFLEAIAKLRFGSKWGFAIASLFFFLIFSPLATVEAVPSCQEQVQEIDKEIDQLEDRRIKALGKANRWEDKAMRWQFMPDQSIETRYAFAQADAARKEAEVIEAQIDNLKRKKQRILQKNGKIP